MVFTRSLRDFYPTTKMTTLNRIERLSYSDWQRVQSEFGQDYRIVEVDLAHSGELYFALNRIAAAANAPHWYGRNMDAFDELINDRPKGNDVFVLRNFDSLCESDRDKFIGLISTDYAEQQGSGFAYFIIIRED